MKLIIFCLFPLVFVSKADERSVEDILHDGNNEFTAKMFTEVVKSNPGKSVVLSAFSVLPPLAQLALASVGESHDELLAAIGMPNDNVTKAAFSQSNERLKSVKGVTLKTASKIYVAKNFELNSEFADLTRNVFGSEVANVDFNENVKVANEVNQWVEDQTNHRIKDLVDSSSLDDTTRALLVNAIYFKGLWENPFRKELTREKDFHVTKDNVVKVPTMYNKDQYKYIDSKELDAQVLELKYEGGDSALYVILPHEVDGITKLEEKLKDPKLLDNVIGDMYETEVEVYLPKFKIETTTDLKDVLEKMNVKRLFSPEDARLDNLLKSAGHLYISDARQKAFIEVNEEGAEAAAANVFGIVDSILVNNEPPTPRFIADRPFTFVIREKSLSLFSGVYGGN
ncbi:alaserpin-like isoform X3 [Danaus plexippus]|uniref:alaserpin-like isoform X3 n=1 Tax=Danaus plexippus TaxID=13037 RepID=UPI002AB05BE6|nr:alaserpin-like isoform X3 [Danaus plexippus]